MSTKHDPMPRFKVWVDDCVMVHGPGHLTTIESAKWVAIYEDINPSANVRTENYIQHYD